MSKLKMIKLAFLTISISAACSVGFAQTSNASNPDMQTLKQSWRNTVLHASLPHKNKEACFHASYPSTKWTEVSCTVAPNRPYAQWAHADGSPSGAVSHMTSQTQTVGDGADYAAQVPGLLTGAIGGFSSATGVTSESGVLGANDYTLQLNSNFMNTAVCSGHSGCQAWQQFIYSSGEQAVFMQYWLLNYGSCPSGWNTYGSDCWKNSAAVSVATIPISDLTNLSVWASASVTNNDLVGLETQSGSITSGDFFSVTEPDSVVDLATGWNEAEFNIFGDGGGSAATFNNGSALSATIFVNQQSGSQAAPTCVSNAGTTGETNNLTLSGCTASAGAGSIHPAISFTESN